MSLISLIHPSRGRAQKSFNTYTEWVTKAGCDVEVLISTDKSDNYGLDYFRLHKPCDANAHLNPGSYTRLYCHDNNSVVSATNVVCQFATTDILIYLSDDFKCPENWGVAVINEFSKYQGPTLIKVDDCLQSFAARVLTIPMMNRALYEELGYFWHPAYKSMWVDCDLYETAERLRALRMAPHLKFPHEHVSIGKAENDETYKRSAANWDQGKALFAKRKAMGFPV